MAFYFRRLRFAVISREFIRSGMSIERGSREGIHWRPILYAYFRGG